MTSKDTDENLEHPNAIPTHVPPEKTPTDFEEADTAPGQDPDGHPPGAADTRRIKSPADASALEPDLPGELIFKLQEIASMSAECLLCKDTGCDMVFLARSSYPGRTKGHAVHSRCVFDHALLQELASGGV